MHLNIIKVHYVFNWQSAGTSNNVVKFSMFLQHLYQPQGFTRLAMLSFQRNQQFKAGG